jgi:hypothetical protein
MRARVTTIIGVIVMSALLVLYMWAAGFQSWLMITTGDPLVVIMGLALVIFPLVGVWALSREVMFGIRSSRLAQRLSDEGDLPLSDLPTRPSGRPERAAADAVFPQFAAAVEVSPEDWRAWFRLGMAYDASGDRRRARASIRRAIALAD